MVASLVPSTSSTTISRHSRPTVSSLEFDNLLRETGEKVQYISAGRDESLLGGARARSQETSPTLDGSDFSPPPSPTTPRRALAFPSHPNSPARSSFAFRIEEEPSLPESNLELAAVIWPQGSVEAKERAAGADSRSEIARLKSSMAEQRYESSPPRSLRLDRSPSLSNRSPKQSAPSSPPKVLRKGAGASKITNGILFNAVASTSSLVSTVRDGAPSSANASKTTLTESRRPAPLKLEPDNYSLMSTETAPKSAFQNTMRKTSRFFRKFAGSSKSSNPGSAPTTPKAEPTSFLPPPPVPAIPSSFVYNPSAPVGYSPTPPAIPTSSSGQLRDFGFAFDTPSSPTTSGIPSSAPAVVPKGAGRDYFSPAAPTDRRRSLSFNSLSTTKASQPAASVSKDPVRSAEDERIRTELYRWKMELDGVIGSIGNKSASGSGGKSPRVNRSPTKERNMSIPNPLPPSQSSPNLASLRQDRTLSAPGTAQTTPPYLSDHRPPSWDATWSDTLSPSPLLTSNAAAFEQATPTEQQVDTPRIQLSSPTGTDDGVLEQATEQIPTPSRRNSVAMDGLGLGLETITETSHSRENSLATPYFEPPVDASSPIDAARPIASVSPIIANSASTSPLPSSSTNSLQSSFSSTLANRKTAMRQSVVVYPAGKSFNFSSESLRRSISVPPSPAIQSPDSPAGSDSFEERAREFAQRCWDEDETFLEPKKIAEWLGATGRLNASALRAYIDMFDFSDLRLDMAFRRLCDKLYLKAETQQVDRILEQFSRRFFNNNPTSVFGSADVVHAVSYSLLLLNTDLHVVETSTRMLRGQFVKNTLSAIRSQGVPESTGPALLFGPNSTGDSNNVFGVSDAMASIKSLDRLRENSTGRFGSSSSRLDLSKNGSPSRNGNDSPRSERAAPFRSVSGGTVGSLSSNLGSNIELESALKEMYNAIKAQPVFQPLSLSSPSDGRSSISLTPAGSPYNTWNGVNRSTSRRSAGSTNSTTSAFKRSSIRGFGSFLGTSSLELPRSSSPTPSNATSLSDDNLSTAYGAVSSNHQISSIGFANSLSHTIIREQQEDDVSDGGASTTDEELALSGAPWAKEGLIHRKHYWEATGKRSKDKTWLQVFVVISRGELRMFRFDGAGTMKGGGTAMGGGDWMSNANSVGTVSLVHALCSPLAAPGYNRDRPYCYVLTLPEGGSYFFQAGTQDLVAEWVSTCNYWSARLSKLPLSGGVSNMEYGWSKILSADDEVEEMGSIRSGRSGRSGRSALSRVSYGGSFQSSFAPPSSMGPPMHINDWTPPNVPTGASTLPEDAQLESLKRYVKITRAELAQHNTLRSPMLKLLVPRSANATKAIANWERKSSYLLSEHVKYQTYVETISAAIKLRNLKRGEREVSAMLQRSDDVADEELSFSPLGLTTSDPAQFIEVGSSRDLQPPPHSASSTAPSQQSQEEYFDPASTSVSPRPSFSNSISRPSAAELES